MIPPKKLALVALALLSLGLAHGAAARPDPSRKPAHAKFTSEFGAEDCTFTDTGRNRYFVLEPGHRLELAGSVKEGLFEVSKTVLSETALIDGVRTRVVEEVETVDGELVELSRNYYALCQETGAVFYFGEEVEILEAGTVVSGEGSWEAGVEGARAGIAMPGTFFVGARYQMETAPGLAMDRVENLEMGLTVQTPAGIFENCVETIETTPLEPGERTIKRHAPGIGAIVDDVLHLVSWTPSELATTE